MRYDTLIVGQVCLDRNTDFDGTYMETFGGAVLFSGHAAAALGNRVAVLPKRNAATVDLSAAFGPASGVHVFGLDSAESTRMENTYFTADRERRISRCTACIDPYRPEELPDVESSIYHIAGLVRGDIGNDMIAACAARGMAAVDVQCMLRCVEPDGAMVFRDWPEKREMVESRYPIFLAFIYLSRVSSPSFSSSSI